MTVDVSYAADVTIDAQCVFEGRLTSPHIWGEAKGAGLYSRAALTVADRFTLRDLHKCDLGPH